MASEFQKALKKAAMSFNRMIRAEAAVKTGMVKCIRDGKVCQTLSGPGIVVCVTCGFKGVWDSGLMHAGHWLGSSGQTIRFEESGCYVQCSVCNCSKRVTGEFNLFMRHEVGEDEMARLEFLKRVPSTLNRQDLYEMDQAFRLRIKAAKQLMGES